MKKMIWLISFILIGLNQLAFALPTNPPEFPLINWVSKNQNDDVVIENGTGNSIIIQITVMDNPTSDAPGIDIKNCGATTHVKAGSSAVCKTNDAKNPVTFSSDSGTSTAAGTYQIKPQ